MQFTCPAGHYCRRGANEPLPCSLGAACPVGTSINRSFLPLAILLLLDLILVSIVVLISLAVCLKLRNKFGRRPVKTSPPKQRRDDRSNSDYYVIDNQQDGQGDVDVALEARLVRLARQRGPGFQEAMAPGFQVSNQDSFTDGQTAPTDLQTYIKSLRRSTGAAEVGLNFEFGGLCYRPAGSDKPIISHISGSIHSRSLWGIMGASGAGKSTFVNVLMGKVSHTSGFTKVNGTQGAISKYKKIIGYVPQDDIILPELTVCENILHSARIRLPYTWSDREIRSHVDVLINCLQLAHVKDSLVGSPTSPVISGGQRKRVSIGIELAAAPMALFLDEPTSGLDATAAASIMNALKALSRIGITVVTIVHQPRQDIFQSLDNLILLGAGRMVYQGPQDQMQAYFEAMGFQFPEHGNPADVMGDIIAGEGRLYKPRGDANVKYLVQQWKERGEKRNSGAAPPTISIHDISSLNDTIKSRGARFYKQLYFCTLRALLQQYRLRSAFFFEIGTASISGFLIGLAQMDREGNLFSGLYHDSYMYLCSAIHYFVVPQMALLISLAIGLCASAPAVKVFGEEKLVYWREAAAGHNRTAYYMGKVMSTLPRIVIATFHFTTTFYLFSTPPMSWTDSFLANLLYFYCIYGLASCVSMVVRREDGPLVAVMVSLIVTVLSGMSPTLTDVRRWRLIWIWRSTPGTWMAEAYFTKNVSPYAYLYRLDLATQATGYHLGHFRRDLLFLLLLGSVYRVVAFFGLRFVHRHRQR
ncbi:hypothetical protein PVAG01_01984 [Phlyctema vagabunda]|uniref:ABC transporter domain-containing protein n=1 Tax=Phlyctema vagabunda TaxID=108571 RepID=A0ABR4PYN3_9HELO